MDAAEWVIVAAAVVTAAGVLRQKVLRPAWRRASDVWRRLLAVHELIERELQPNGGGSMKDQTGFTVLQMDRVTRQLAQVEAVQGATFDVLDSINSRNHDEHTEIWTALAEHGIDRRRPPADPGNGAT